MAKSPRTLISETRTSIGLIEQELESFIVTRDELNRQLRNARARLQRKQSDAYPNKLIKQLLEELKFSARVLLISEMDSATTKSREFSHPAYVSALYQAADDDTIYKFIVSGSGWNVHVSPQIVLEGVAGTINDYAKGILSYRAHLGTKTGEPGSKRGARATKYWKEKVFGTDRQRVAIEERIDRSDKIAPFWQILNSGGTTLASDRPDDSYNPISQPPTGFIVDAETKISNEFVNQFIPEKLRWHQETKELIAFIEDVKQERDAASNSIRNLRIEAKQNKVIFDSFGEIKKFVSSGKIDSAMRRYRAGEEFERVLVSKPSAKRRVYLTAQRVKGLID